MNKKVVESYVRIAKEIAMAPSCKKKSNHVSIVISGKSIIAIGQNGHKTHTLAREKNYAGLIVHSELDAFSKIRYKNGAFTLLNFRFNKKGELANSKPCKFCMPWCVEFFEEIWYSTDNGMIKLEE